MTTRVAFTALGLIPRLMLAQGVTTAAIEGTVATHDGAAVSRASITVTNTSDGRRWSLTTSAGGAYALEDAAVGGPYRIEVRSIGFGPVSRSGIVLALGQRVIADFVLEPTPIQLSAVSVTASSDVTLSSGRTGPAQIVSALRITTLPNLGRDFVNLTLLSPQAAISPSSRFAQTEGLTIAGQNRLLNGFQVDGGINQDMYTGRMQPGLQTWPRPISLEAIDEIQVLSAPIDVRYGGFSGGVVNTVTKAGTNELHGSAFYSGTGAALTSRNATRTRAGGFGVAQFGGSVGGPLVRDRVHYFASADIYRRTIADAGPLIIDTAGGADLANIGIRYTSAAQFQRILQDTYSLEPGTLGPYEGSAPAVDMFAKISVQLATNSHLELSHHYIDGERKTYINRQYGTYFLSSLGQHNPADEHASRLIWSSVLGDRWSNELIASYLRLSEACRPNASYPLISVSADLGTLTAGASTACPSKWSQHDLELTENLTVGIGAHFITMGAHAEALRFDDAQLGGSAGSWTFRNLDSLEAGQARHYERAISATPSGSGFGFGPRQFGVYVQDRWRPTHDVTLTAGLRADVSFLPDHVETNAALLNSLGVDNAVRPNGNALWSPRLGVNYDVAGRGRTFVRGGVGLFTGRPPYSWLAGPYRDDGVHQLFLTCDGTQVPRFDPLKQPTTCVNGAAPPPRLSFFDRGVRFPQSLKTFLGVDQRLPGDVIGTLDLLYTRAGHQMYLSDANLPSPVGVAAGEGNRPLYGVVNAAGIATLARPAASLGQVVRLSNHDGDYSASGSIQLRKEFANRAELSALYARTRAFDRLTIVNLMAKNNLETTPLDGTLDDRRLTTSSFEIPHRVDVDALLRLPYRVALSLRYSGVSGTPYTYTIRGDANADGIGTSNMTDDIVYVPRDRSDISIDGNGAAPGIGTTVQQDSVYGTIDRYIEREPCLRRQRGRLLARNSCRNPWFGTLNVRTTKVFPTSAGQALEVNVDIYNLLNLLNKDWGQARVTTLEPGVPLLMLSGYDTSLARGIYRPLFPGFRQLQDLASRSQTEITVRYIF